VGHNSNTSLHRWGSRLGVASLLRWRKGEYIAPCRYTIYEAESPLLSVVAWYHRHRLTEPGMCTYKHGSPGPTTVTLPGCDRTRALGSRLPLPVMGQLPYPAAGVRGPGAFSGGAP
jgi:hypothetical protein